MYDLYRITMRQCSTCERWGKVEIVGSLVNGAMYETDGVVEGNCPVDNKPRRGSSSCVKWTPRPKP